MATTAQKVILVTVGAGAAFLIGRKVFAKPRTKPAPPIPDDDELPPVYDYSGLIEEFESTPGEPVPGTFYYQRQGDMLFDIARMTLQNAGIPNTAANRIALVRLIECSPYNDAVYGVRLSENAFGQRFRNDQPYGISGNPQHHDNLLRMKQGLPVRRAAQRNSMSGHETVPGGGRHAAMWIPLLAQDIQVVGPNAVLAWQDGSSAINPPPEILNLDMENVPPGEYGCAPWRASVESL